MGEAGAGWQGKGDWWHVNEFEERGLSWAYVGTVKRPRGHVAAILAGKLGVVTAARYGGAGGARAIWDNQAVRTP